MEMVIHNTEIAPMIDIVKTPWAGSIKSTTAMTVTTATIFKVINLQGHFLSFISFISFIKLKLNQPVVWRDRCPSAARK